MRQLRIIDALGPFTELDNLPDGAVVNWSKVRFADLEEQGRLPEATRQRIAARFEAYAKAVAAQGYTGLSLDDLAHFLKLPFYNPSLQKLLGDYQGLYRELLRIAQDHQLGVFINTDFLFYNEDIRNYLQKQQLSPQDFFSSLIEELFADFPELEGLILRIGENDGKDVSGTFLSELGLQTPEQANTLVTKILPIFERHSKLLVFRTWTVGAHPIGDIIWNKQTFDTVFGSIDSDALVISMKFGDTDFMRYLRLNPLIKSCLHNKILEFQTRREWEGMGTIPSFVGWDYEGYLEELADDPTFIGIHVWCQTGGWATKAWDNVTFLQNSSFWVELNTFVTAYMCQHNTSANEAVQAFCKSQNIQDKQKFLELLRLADIVIHKGWYIHELAHQPYYFRRTRLPTLLWLNWDRLQVDSVMLLRPLVAKPQTAAAETKEAAEYARQMVGLAADLQLPEPVIESLRFTQATLDLFVELKAYMLGTAYCNDVSQLQHKADVYMQKFPQHLTIQPLKTLPHGKRLPRWLVRFILRRSAGYRLRDRLMLATSPLQRRLVNLYLRKSGSHLADQSMGLDVLFK